MSFNTSKSTYQIILTATIPIFNPNYMPIQVSGSLVVSFYDQQAGVTSLDPVSIPARAFPQVISMEMDASSVPQQYLFTIYTQCFTFPERIIFFLTGKLQSKYMGWVFPIPDIDNYFIISCTNAPDRRPDPPGSPRPAKPPHPPYAPPRPPRSPRLAEAEDEAPATEDAARGAAAGGTREGRGLGEAGAAVEVEVKHGGAALRSSMVALRNAMAMRVDGLPHDGPEPRDAEMGVV
ncbi:hypothetical protein GPECTOR_32g500 [Gonium pectorale]|uniref:Uncharacterized protein n=1 Tax=Gonium pectorale TaxID=33097 RepID=A0A150GDG0_GONPE|nr:hypothetical protein GPECTOR_32g500 [Gonium pectorale]|eukprot:KXZ47887.1 hypothetical protein GPECTOR_32g500 [Gonium pectorale]